MKNQPATYGRTRTDWSSEVKTAPGDARSGMNDTNGMSDHRTASGMGPNGIASDTGQHSMIYSTGSVNNNGMVSATGRGVNNNRMASDTGYGMNNNAMVSATGRGANNNRTASDMNNSRMASDTGRGGMEQDMLSAEDWLPDADTLILPERDGNPVPMGPRTIPADEISEVWPNIENNLSNEVIESPTTMEEVYRGSMKSLLLRNVGNYVVATFLIGTQTTVSWEGILYDVGNDYLAIYQSGRDQYIVSDLYSLKYVEFYDTRRRELCDSLLTEQQPSGNSQR